jgi:hypothetical protein
MRRPALDVTIERTAECNGFEITANFGIHHAITVLMVTIINAIIATFRCDIATDLR